MPISSELAGLVELRVGPWRAVGERRPEPVHPSRRDDDAEPDDRHEQDAPGRPGKDLRRAVLELRELRPERDQPGHLRRDDPRGRLLGGRGR